MQLMYCSLHSLFGKMQQFLFFLYFPILDSIFLEKKIITEHSHEAKLTIEHNNFSKELVRASALDKY